MKPIRACLPSGRCGCWLLMFPLSCALAGVTEVPAGNAPPQLSLPRVPTPDLTGADVYDVDPQASSVHVLVYRAGKFARLGHNHVVTVLGLTGRLWISRLTEQSGFELSFPVAELLVDDPDARRAFGPDFPPMVSDADRAGTRRNMLRPEVLDAERYPSVIVRSRSVIGPVQAPHLTARITIKDVDRDLALTPLIEVNGARLTATGEFDIDQSDFGIRPFTALLGSLEVQDRLHVQFSLSAVARQNGIATSP